jgi:hypothetical protein
MKNSFLVAVIVAFCLSNAAGQAKVLTNDPLTGLPLTPASVVAKDAGNAPVKMPDGHVCKSKMQGDFYTLFNYFSKGNIKYSEAISWYSAHLPGFKKVQGSQSKTTQTALYNSDGTVVVILTSEFGPQDENTKTHGVAYERYQPGLSEKTITSLTQEKIVCQ